MVTLVTSPVGCHCEEPSDAAIQPVRREICGDKFMQKITWRGFCLEKPL